MDEILHELLERFLRERLTLEADLFEFVSPACNERNVFCPGCRFYLVQERTEEPAIVIAGRKQLVSVLFVSEHAELRESVR